MILEKNSLLLDDIPKFFKTSKNNVSNWRKTDAWMTKPLGQISSWSIRKSEDITDYSQNKKESDIIPSENLKLKTIAIIGRSRGGKSFLVSRFVENKSKFVELFCGNSGDKTMCPINVMISDSEKPVQYAFHTDFNTKIPKNEFEDSLVKSIRDRISSLKDNNFFSDNTNEMKIIEKLIRDIRDVEKSKKIKINTFINIYEKPSCFCKELLRENGLETIKIIDTPGVSGQVEASKIAKSDVYLFLIKPDNMDEASTLKKIVEEIKSDVATSKVAFLYKKEGCYGDQQAYEKARKSIKEDMETYNELFSELRGSIVSTELDVLNPAAHSIMFPTMSIDGGELAEKLFMSELKNKLTDAFNPNDSIDLDKEFLDILKTKGEKAKELYCPLKSGHGNKGVF